MTIKKAIRYPIAKGVIVRATGETMSILTIEYSDPQKVGRITNAMFLLDDWKWYNYKNLAEMR